MPEIKLKVKKGNITATCHACGKASKMDTIHKIATYILKNPPKNDTEFGGKDKTKKKGAKEEKKAKTGHSEDTEKEPKKAEEEKVPEALTLDSPEMIETIQRVKEYKEGQKHSSTELLDQIRNICISQGLKEDFRYYVAMHGLYDDKFLYQWNQEESYKETLKMMVKNETKGQYWVLLSLAWFLLRTHKETLEKHINTVLKCFYDYEILDEETILKCYGKEGSLKTLSSGGTFNKALVNEFKTKSAGFINWLEEAEEEDGEGEDEKETEEEKVDEKTRKQRELIAEQKRKQEEQLKENMDKKSGDKEDDEEKSTEAKTMNILDIKTEENEEKADLDDL